VKEIELSNGQIALVDDCDYEYLSQWRWYIAGKGYAMRIERKVTIYMHRVVAGTLVGMNTDHINRNKLDNRRSNLRVCTGSQNNANMAVRKNNTSGKKGVYWHKKAHKWLAQIWYNKNIVYLGIYDSIDDAYHAYCKKAEELYGEFANI
jgi:hypothetical protein